MPNWEDRGPETEIPENLECLEMKQKKFHWYEFFAGGGMARLGLGRQWHCAFANEWCEKKGRAYRAYFGDAPELKLQDIRSISARDLPDIPDLVWALFPCQDLSLAGSGAGLGGSRSGTFSTFWKLMQGLISEGRQPRVVVLENVVGALTSHGGKDFTTLIRTISDNGYVVGAIVVNAVYFVPQSRPRLFIVAVRAEEQIPAILKASSSSRLWHPPSLLTAYRKLPDTCKAKWVWFNIPLPRIDNIPTLSSIIEEIPTGVRWHSAEETKRLMGLMSEGNRRKLRQVQYEGSQRIGTIYKRTRPVSSAANARRVQRAEIRLDGISGCLRTPVGGSSRQTIMIVHGSMIKSRLLSPREAARLMGVPDEYPVPRNYNEAYHLFGDGLVVPVVSWLEKHLLRPLVQSRAMKQVA
jgi:DNA (cytosine-5)-methyltransferase 1